MLFGHTLIALLASTALTSAAAIAPASVDEHHDLSLADRSTKNTNPFAKIKASKATWAKAAKLCKQGSHKRELDEFDGEYYLYDDYDSLAPSPDESLTTTINNNANFKLRTNTWPPQPPAGFTSVEMGKQKGERDPMGLRTYGLVTCLGIGGTGTQADGSKNERFLMHLVAAQTGMERHIPDTRETTWDAEFREFNDDLHQAVEEVLQELVGRAPKVVKRPVAPALAHTLPHGTMQIDRENRVQVDGRAVA
ncbi:uncharacterized protein BO97DRAFT_474516 [Aspergillus homomorphus CBS 101889]|uniref:Uncharacterized protein n=1 Tax=Aspergillus homomorphus (strain CBS 101889) TaxID=1450537 RepID=A0A395IBE5_ASPHC|nr:hypothetical protein BO97DRAFT_474516 [Aspergillus homomorphus CBS 101889]RAL17552.1 hypothetical protein BO97DRAFT_474516 [Aspergillus homomorphus CBS 101889]